MFNVDHLSNCLINMFNSFDGPHMPTCQGPSSMTWSNVAFKVRTAQTVPDYYSLFQRRLFLLYLFYFPARDPLFPSASFASTSETYRERGLRAWRVDRNGNGQPEGGLPPPHSHRNAIPAARAHQDMVRCETAKTPWIQVLSVALMPRIC